MRRQVDHHLARARAIGRRASAHARTRVWDSLEAVQRAVERLYEGVTGGGSGCRVAGETEENTFDVAVDSAIGAT